MPASTAKSVRFSATASASVGTIPPSPSSASKADEMKQEVRLDLGRIANRDVRAIGEKVLAGSRLSQADAHFLFTTPDLLGIGLLADYANRRKHGDVVTF